MTAAHCFNRHICLMLFAAVLMTARSIDQLRAHEMTIAGYVERTWFNGSSFWLDAKLDTGATTSSIHAQKLKRLERDGQSWIRIALKDTDGVSHSVEGAVVRTAHVKRAGAPTQERPVILLTVCVAGKTAQSEFTLTDRIGMDYPVLIGRSFLQGRVLVDSARTNLGRGKCGSDTNWIR